MKTKILIAVAALVVLGGAAFVVAGSGVKANADEMEKMRGTDGYYSESELMTAATPYGESELLMNLQDGKIAKVGFNVEYRLGKEWMERPEMAAAAFTERAVEIRSELILLTSSKKSSELKGADLLLYREEIIQMLNDVVFPKRMARVEKVHFTTMIVQG